MHDPFDPIDVIRGLHAGTREAWTTLYDRYSGEVWRYVARLLGPQANNIADVVQETFLGAARSARGFDANKGTLGGWLIGIAHHQVTLHWRQFQRVERLRKLAEEGAAEIRHWLDSEEPLTDAWDRRELADLVRAVLSETSPDYAALLTAKYLDERSLEEIAQENGATMDGVKSKLARARKEFRTKFEHLTREPTPSLPE